jgi:hypothetical protein
MVTARVVMHALVLIVVFAASATARAETEVPPEVTSAAVQAGVDELDLLGAVVTTGLGPFEYLYDVGELQRPRPSTPPLVGAVARADCIISKESGGRDVPNAQGSPARGPGQYFPGTWESHVALYRQGTGYAGPLSLHSLQDVRRVMAWILQHYPGSRSAWVVGGC